MVYQHLRRIDGGVVTDKVGNCGVDEKEKRSGISAREHEILGLGWLNEIAVEIEDASRNKRLFHLRSAVLLCSRVRATDDGPQDNRQAASRLATSLE